MKYFIIVLIAIVVVGSGVASYYLVRNDDLLSKIRNPENISTTQAAVAEEPHTNKGSIIIGGDVMLARWVEQKSLSSGGWTSLFEKIRDTLKKPNCTIVNLESPMKGQKPQTKINSLIFAAKPESAEALTDAGVDAVSLANNHITDQGSEGFSETTTILNEKKINYVGAGDNAEKAIEYKILSCGGVKVGFVSATYGTNFPAEGVSVAPLEDIIQTIKDIETVVDYTIVYPHWGTEYNTSPSPYQKELAHEYIDAGADLVAGSHPHVLQPIEIYKDKTIAYSLGNLAFDQASSGKKTEGALLSLNLDDKIQKFTIIPIQIESFFRPALAEGDTNSFKESLGLKDLSWSLPR